MYKVRIWSKPATQSFIKSLREAGYKVQREPNGAYSVWALEGNEHSGDDLVFSCLPGRRGYLCRVNDKYVKSIDE